MIQVLEGKDYPDAARFVADLNKARQAHPRQWMTYAGHVDGCAVALKTFGHGDLQIVRVDGRDVRRQEYGMTITQWRAEIETVVGGAIARRAAA